MESVFSDISNRMKKTVDLLRSEYSMIVAGRANPAVLDKVYVDYYGTPTMISHLASVSISEARVITIQPWDLTVLPLIEKAILTSDIGINPQNDGKVIRLIFPELNEEMRKNLVKDISNMAENSKISIRSIRRDGIDSIKNMKRESQITEDDLKFGEKEIQSITDGCIKEIDEICKNKSAEVMKI